MKKNDKETAIVKKVLKNVAVHYANVACPFLTYQPKVSEQVQKLRKF